MCFSESNLFKSVDAIVLWLDKKPDDWRQYPDILECWISKYTYCKIWTGDGPLSYLVALSEGIYRPSPWEKYKLWRAIGRYRKYIVKSLLVKKE